MQPEIVVSWLVLVLTILAEMRTSRASFYDSVFPLDGPTFTNYELSENNNPMTATRKRKKTKLKKKMNALKKATNSNGRLTAQTDFILSNTSRRLLNIFGG